MLDYIKKFLDMRTIDHKYLVLMLKVENELVTTFDSTMESDYKFREYVTSPLQITYDSSLFWSMENEQDKFDVLVKTIKQYLEVEDKPK